MSSSLCYPCSTSGRVLPALAPPAPMLPALAPPAPMFPALAPPAPLPRPGRPRAHSGLSPASNRQLGPRPKLPSPSASAASPPPPPPAPAQVAVFVSGGGSNMRALAAGMDSGRVPAQLCAVVSSSAHCAGAQWARDRGVPVILYPPTPALLASSHELEGVARLSGSGDAVARSPQELVELLRTLHGASIVCLAGYLKLVPAELVRAFPKAMLNIHPSLLPAFGGAGMYGARVHRAVVARGARVSGATVHFVSEEFDEGAILAQAAVPVYPADAPADVAARVLQQEHQLFPTCLAALAGGSVVWRPDGVPYIKDEG